VAARRARSTPRSCGARPRGRVRAPAGPGGSGA
jgi:hypothetical protein